MSVGTVLLPRRRPAKTAHSESGPYPAGFRKVGTVLRTVRDTMSRDMTFPQRRRLPHEIPAWVEDGGTYFITICTAPKGNNQLCTPDMFAWLRDSLFHVEQRGIWWLRLVVVMPDHLHALMCFARDPGIKRSLTQWKRYVAAQKGIHWQRDFFEHRLRNDAECLEKSSYILQNPVRAGLCDSSASWPYMWSRQGQDGPLGERALPGRIQKGRDGSPNRPESGQEGEVRASSRRSCG